MSVLRNRQQAAIELIAFDSTFSLWMITCCRLGPTAGGMQLHAAWGDPASAEQGSALPLKPLVYAQETAVVRTFAEAEALGEAVAERLRAGGAFWAANAPATPAA